MKRVAGIILVGIMLAAIALAVLSLRVGRQKSKPAETKTEQHLYVTWDTMEFDKCVSAWLIVRFIDANAHFSFVPQGTEIVTGIPFDIPGAEWSRKHRKCTSQCILDAIKNPDPAMEKIVSIASQTELNFWQLESFPEAKKHFDNVRVIMEQNPNTIECFEKTNIYFDNLYENFRKGDL